MRLRCYSRTESLYGPMSLKPNPPSCLVTSSARPDIVGCCYQLTPMTVELPSAPYPSSATVSSIS
eukprot:346230-Rhodomonas_salina.2